MHNPHDPRRFNAYNPHDLSHNQRHAGYSAEEPQPESKPLSGWAILGLLAVGTAAVVGVVAAAAAVFSDE